MNDTDRDGPPAGRKRRIGPEHAGGYAGQRFDLDRHGGSYGGNEGAGGGHLNEPGDGAKLRLGQQHMSGRHGDKAYGRTDGVTSNIPRDASQHQGVVTAGGGGPAKRRDAPGIPTDERSDDTRP